MLSAMTKGLIRSQNCRAGVDGAETGDKPKSAGWALVNRTLEISRVGQPPGADVGNGNGGLRFAVSQVSEARPGAPIHCGIVRRGPPGSKRRKGSQFHE